MMCFHTITVIVGSREFPVTGEGSTPAEARDQAQLRAYTLGLELAQELVARQGGHIPLQAGDRHFQVTIEGVTELPQLDQWPGGTE